MEQLNIHDKNKILWLREMLKKNAPYVYQQVSLHKPLEIQQTKIELTSGMTPQEEQGANNFQNYLDDEKYGR